MMGSKPRREKKRNNGIERKTIKKRGVDRKRQKKKCKKIDKHSKAIKGKVEEGKTRSDKS